MSVRKRSTGRIHAFSDMLGFFSLDFPSSQESASRIPPLPPSATTDPLGRCQMPGRRSCSASPLPCLVAPQAALKRVAKLFPDTVDKLRQLCAFGPADGEACAMKVRVVDLLLATCLAGSRLWFSCLGSCPIDPVVEFGWIQVLRSFGRHSFNNRGISSKMY